MSQVYEINKGVMKSIEFKGLKAQYIAYLAAGLVVLLLLFAISYIIGLPSMVSVGGVLLLGYLLFSNVFRYSQKYGEYGLMKESAFRKVPSALICRKRRIFFELKQKEVCNDHRERTQSHRAGSTRAAHERDKNRY